MLALIYPRRTRRSAVVVTAISGGWTDTATSPDDATCTLNVLANGGYTVDGLATGSIASGFWRTGGGTGSDYWIRWTNTSGTLSSGTAGSWLSLASNRAFGVTFTSPNGSKTCVGTVEIATDSGGANVVASGSVSITAQVDP